jgi:hypothetical protein
VSVSVEDLGEHGQCSLTVRVELGCGLVNGAAADGLEDCAVRRRRRARRCLDQRLDNSLLAQLSQIDLTSVSPEPREQANCAVAAVVERLDSGRTAAVSWVLQPRLIVRDAPAPAPAPKNASAT